MSPPARRGSTPDPRRRRPPARPAGGAKRPVAGKRPAARRPTARTKAPAKRARPLSPTRLLGALIASALVAGFLLVAVFPTRTLLTQRADTAEARSQLAELEASNRQLTQRVAKLGTREEIERIAREEHGMVRPGEEAYAVLPRPEDPVVLPEVWPFVGAADELNR